MVISGFFQIRVGTCLSGRGEMGVSRRYFEPIEFQQSTLFMKETEDRGLGAYECMLLYGVLLDLEFYDLVKNIRG